MKWSLLSCAATFAATAGLLALDFLPTPWAKAPAGFEARHAGEDREALAAELGIGGARRGR
jgi:hypothetical protein